MPQPSNRTGAEREIIRRISRRGPITFAEFMELALFWPEGGYYMGKSPVGASGDFFTSPSLHPAFGALLAVQLLQFWYLLGRPLDFTVVEMGAGNGILARDIVSYSRRLDAGFADSMRYVCLDHLRQSGLESRSNDTTAISRVAAAVPTGTKAGKGKRDTPGLPLRGITGCVLSNELIDAFPVHQVKLERGALLEVYVTLENHELTETTGQLSTPKLAERLEREKVALQEGQTAEINLGIDVWIEEVADVLEQGFVLTVDYGDTSSLLYSFDTRPQGTLTTYYRHTQIDNPFRHVGRQDMTSQVDFTAVVQQGRKHGLELLGYTRQREFLNVLGLNRWQRSLAGLGLSQREANLNRAGLLELAKVGSLGDFKVLVQGKKVGTPELWGFPDKDRAKPSEERPNNLPVPLQTQEHLPLIEGRYPRAEQELTLDKLWPPGFS